MKLLFASLLFAVSANAADIHVLHNGVEVFCATGSPMGFDGPTNYTGTCVAPPPPPGTCTGPAGLTRLTRSNISYGASGSAQRANADVTEWNNIWGFSDPTRTVPLAWAGVSGAGPVIRQFGRRTFLAAHFNTGPVPMYQGSLTDQSNIGGPDIDVVVSTTCGDFLPNTQFPGCSRFAMPSDGVTHFQYFSNGANPGSIWCPLLLGTDYYLNVKIHDPTSATECAVSSQTCPLYTINYWDAVPPSAPRKQSDPIAAVRAR